jgi:23S rRNA pseudouridine1911/1915/1917 synthase
MQKMTERIIECTVNSDVGSVRADKYFASKFDDVSRSKLQFAFDAGLVTFDDVVIDKRFKLTQPGHLRAVLEEPDLTAGPKAVAIPLQIIYEDEVIIVINKAAGMITHPGNGTSDDTLVHALLHHTSGMLSSVGSPDRPGIVHRLDKETSGLIVVAKTDLAHHKLAAAFADRVTYKSYQALVLGIPDRQFGSIKEPIGRHRVVRTRMAVQVNGRSAHTDWRVVEKYGEVAALLNCVIHTGRTHQIRVHMSHLQHTLLGDKSYGYKEHSLQSVAVPRVMLHSTELKLRHPRSNERMHFQAPIPEDFDQVIKKLKNI